MEQKTEDLARKMFQTVMATAQGLETITKEERIKIFKAVAEYCFEAAYAFETVAAEK